MSGTWKATTKAVVLQPSGEGRPSAPIPMTVAISGAKAKVEGTIVPRRRIFGELDVIGLYGKPHTVKDADLVGTWSFTTKNDEDGFQANLDGTRLFVGDQYEHVVTFRDTGSYLEDRLELGKKSRRKKDDGTYTIAGSPDGKGGPGIVILDRSGLWDEVRIVKLAGTKLSLDVNPGEHAERVEAVKKP